MKELIEKIIATLIYYKINGKDKFVSLKRVIDILDNKINFEDIFNIAKYLEAQGYISAEYIYGDVLARITTLGQITYEERYKEIMPKIIDMITNQELKENLDKIADEITEDSIKRSFEDIKKLIDEIKKDVDESSENGKKKDYLNSLKIIKISLESDTLNTDILASAYNTLAESKVVPHKIRELGALLNLGIV
jgi:hypothetical protein